jgi:hypothetical protein
VEGHYGYKRKLRAVSAYVDGERLHPSSEGGRVSSRYLQPRIDAGPFAMLGARRERRSLRVGMRDGRAVRPEERAVHRKEWTEDAEEREEHRDE